MSRRGACYPMRTRQFVALPAMRRDAEFPDDPRGGVVSDRGSAPACDRGFRSIQGRLTEALI